MVQILKIFDIFLIFLKNVFICIQMFKEVLFSQKLVFFWNGVEYFKFIFDFKSIWAL